MGTCFHDAIIAESQGGLGPVAALVKHILNYFSIHSAHCGRHGPRVLIINRAEYRYGTLEVSYQGRSSPIFVYVCAISEFQTPPFDRVCHHQKFDPFVKQIWEKINKKWIKKHESEDLRNFLPLKLDMHMLFLGEKQKRTLLQGTFEAKKGAFCKANLKSGPL